MEVAKKLDFLESVPLEVGNAHEPTAYKEYLGAFAELQRYLTRTHIVAMQLAFSRAT